MRVLMLGWEFPPYHSGGLGIASKGIAEALIGRGVDITFVLPRKLPISHEHIRFIFADIPEAAKGAHEFHPYHSSYNSKVARELAKLDLKDPLLDQIYNYSARVREIAKREDFDVIHAHDWWTYPAGIAARESTGKPLIIHVHATSFDQSGRGPVDPRQFDIENKAIEEADAIVAVSNYVKQTVVQEHGADPDKVFVVHNGVSTEVFDRVMDKVEGIELLKQKGNKIVLYLGRMTIQKGPDYFVQAARRVLDHYPNVYFVMNGEGDMFHQIVDQVAALGMSDRFIFSEGFDEKAIRLFHAADLYVMPSVSEPFGLVAVEAQLSNTPVIISKQSGVSEVLKHVLKVDFWDIEEMANKIIAVLNYKGLSKQLITHGKVEARSITWHKTAEKVVEIYDRIINFFKK